MVGPGEGRPATASALKHQVLEIVRRFGYERREEPFQLSSGEMSRDYIDGKRAFADGERLGTVARAVIAVARERNTAFDAVGGLTMGADALAHAISVVAPCSWFAVRKERKGHGKQKQLEGAELGAQARVLLVDDVVTTGASIIKALDAVTDTEASIVLAVSICDRGDLASEQLEDRGVPYETLVSYQDLGIAPVTQRASA